MFVISYGAEAWGYLNLNNFNWKTALADRAAVLTAHLIMRHISCIC